MPDGIDELLDPTYRGRIHVRLTRIASPEEARARLAAITGEGWVCTAQEAKRKRVGDALPVGVPLSAELVTGASASVHVRHTGDGWLFAEMTEELRDAVEAREGDDYAFEEVFASTEGPNSMRYRIWWRLDDGVYHPYAARFAGWEDG